MLSSPSTKFIYDIDNENINNDTYVINIKNNDKIKNNKTSDIMNICLANKICFLVDKVGLLYMLFVCCIIVLFYVLLFIFVMDNIFAIAGLKF